MGSDSVPGFCLPLRLGSHCSPGYFREASWIKRRVVQPFPMSILDQANIPRRLVSHDDDSDVSSCAYPCATVLGGIRGWAQRDRLSFPLHGVESQSQPWGPCIILASRREEFHLYRTQVIKDLSGPSPSSLTDHVISRERIAASPCGTAFPPSDYYGHADSLSMHRGISGDVSSSLIPLSFTSSKGSPKFLVMDSVQPCRWWLSSNL